MDSTSTGEAHTRTPAKLHCYALHEFAPKLVAARPDRKWMDEFPDRHAYRCLPLSIANAYGWHVLCPAPIEISWNGGSASSDLTIRALKPLSGLRPVEHFCRSNFSRGIITLHADYLFMTEPGWNLVATGPFNQPKENAYPLTGIIESDWLPYPFTMNWQVLRPGRVIFEEDEPFCCVYPIQKNALSDCIPEIRRLSENAEVSRQHDAFRAERDSFMARFNAGEERTIKQAWQKHYFVGRHPDGTPAQDHVNKLRLSEPVDLREPVVPRNWGQPYRVSITAARPAQRMVPKHWTKNSPLNRIDPSQTDANRSGRRRLSLDGRLSDWSKTRVIRSEQDAAGCDFVVAELLSSDQCATLVGAFHDLGHLIFKSDEIDPYWNSRFLWFADIAKAQPETGRLMIDAQREAQQRIAKFYQLTAPIYPDLLQIVCWREGMFMKPHADNANPDGAAHGMSHRDISGIVYLNDDYEGGELYFTSLDIAIKPKRGMFVAMTAGFHHEHAVLRVEKGTRLTMPFFTTFDSSKADRSLVKADAR